MSEHKKWCTEDKNLKIVEPFTIHLIQLKWFKHGEHESAGSQINTDVNLWRLNFIALEFSSYWKKKLSTVYLVLA